MRKFVAEAQILTSMNDLYPKLSDKNNVTISTSRPISPQLIIPLVNYLSISLYRCLHIYLCVYLPV